MRGRRPKPDALKKAQGNPGRRQLDAAPATPATSTEPQHAPASIAAPAELQDQRALEVWQRTAPRLSGLNFIQPTDHDAFARYCKYLSLWYRLAAKIDVDRLVITTKSDAVEMDRLDRNFQAMLLLDKRLEGLEDRFGLNPQARQQLLRLKSTSLGAQLPGMPPQQTPASKAETETPAPAPSARPFAGSSIGALQRPRQLN